MAQFDYNTYNALDKQLNAYISNPLDSMLASFGTSRKSWTIYTEILPTKALRISTKQKQQFKNL